MLSVALSACTAHSTVATLRIADLANPSSLDPLLAHDQETIGNDLLVVQTLTGLDAANRVVPILLTRVPSRANGDLSADGRRITYHLRRGVRFADGVELTAADVAFTYRAIVDPRNPVLSQDSYRRIAALRTPDRYTVTVSLKRPWNAAVYDLFAQSDFAFGILPAHAFASPLVQHAAWENHAFGTGPYRVAEWRRGDRIVLEPNPYFSPKPLLGRIEFHIIPNANTAALALRTRDVDVAPLDTPETVLQATRSSALRVVRTPLNGMVYLDVQSAALPGNRRAVRRALAAALDMPTVRKAFENVYPRAAAFVPPVMRAWHDAAVAPYAYDPRLARAVNRAAPLDVTLVLQAENPLYVHIATVVQQQLDRAGFHTTLKPFPATLFNAPDGPLRTGRFTLALAGWLGGADPEQSVTFTCADATSNGSNASRYCNPRFDAAFADQATTRSSARRRADFFEMQRFVHADVPEIPLYYLTWFDGVDERVHGFARNMLEYPVAPERWSLAR